ncbi:ROK family transcriptional regulator [Rhizobium halophytocola]|uniref:NBD/HSP70 family sugar kinase n=1 Tax=Rhizobium halophytocola TaxID=735519 RepID=A0ABS4E562_9HYPH|nr:ROK family transcriptional regulator [Rhizobium halophytocola]MBP1853089.1 putative NBD/HSP70 family sugar kinase [Rhizobium halophytocola]
MLAKSSTEMVRQQNSALVLRALRRHERLAHTEIAVVTGLASATISAITGDLERAGIIERSEQQAATGRGRPRVLFTQNRSAAYLIAVSISSDAAQYSLADYSGRLIDRFAEPRSLGGAKVFLSAMTGALGRLAERSRLPHSAIKAISISSKGLVDPERPVLLWSPVLGSDPCDFGAALAQDWQARVLLSNETLLVARALSQKAERQNGALARGMVTLSLGHSIGLGVALRRGDGELEVRAPNFGHMLHVPDGALCRCGAQGCIEAHAGFYAILRTAFKVPKNTIPAPFVPVGEVDKLAGRARAGERMPAYAFREAGLALGFGLSRVLSLYGHLPVAVTGVGARYYDLLKAGLEEGLGRSQVVRMGGLPEISIMPDEPMLIFDGHLDRALAAIDEAIVSAGV